MTFRLYMGRRAGLLFACVAALAGCGQGGSSGVDDTQVAVRVNGQEISVPQLEHVVQRLGQSAAGPGGPRRVLDVLVSQELAAQAARKQGLDRDPRVIQALEAAKRELLAKAYGDVLAENASLPSSEEVDRYYDAHPALFSQRRLYILQEIAVEGLTDKLQALQSRVESVSGAAAAADVVRETGLRHSVRQLTTSPEDVPLPLLERLAELRDGQSLLVPQSGVARILTLLSSRPASVSRDSARRSIQAFLVNERKGKAMADGLKALREEAKIEYKGKFAQAAAGEPASAASAPVAR